jgi:hypothetical protein
MNHLFFAHEHFIEESSAHAHIVPSVIFWFESLKHNDKMLVPFW